MQQMTEQNKQQLINIINQHSKQKSKKITENLYKLLFIDQVKQLYDNFFLSQFQLKDNYDKEKDISFYFFRYNNPVLYDRYLYSRNEQVVSQFNNKFLNLKKYTVGESSSRLDRLNGIFKNLYLKHDSQIYKEWLEKYSKYLEQQRKKEEQAKRKREQEKKKRVEREVKRQKARQYSKQASQKIDYARPSRISILSVDNHSSSFENPKLFLDIAVVYGIVIENKIVYIGSTEVLSERIKTHIECVNNKNIQNFQQNWLYKEMREKGYQFVILFKGQKVVNRQQLNNIQFGYITKYQPKYNYKGVRSNYTWADRREEKKKVTWDEWVYYKE